MKCLFLLLPLIFLLSSCREQGPEEGQTQHPKLSLALLEKEVFRDPIFQKARQHDLVQRALSVRSQQQHAYIQARNSHPELTEAREAYSAALKTDAENLLELQKAMKAKEASLPDLQQITKEIQRAQSGVYEAYILALRDLDLPESHAMADRFDHAVKQTLP